MLFMGHRGVLDCCAVYGTSGCTRDFSLARHCHLLIPPLHPLFSPHQDAEAALKIECVPMRLYSEEQEDGEERPDLDFGLTVSGCVGGRSGTPHL